MNFVRTRSVKENFKPIYEITMYEEYARIKKNSVCLIFNKSQKHCTRSFLFNETKWTEGKHFFNEIAPKDMYTTPDFVSHVVLC